MKVTFIDYYNSASSPHRDPISIPQGLAVLGAEIELVTRADYNQDQLFGFKVRKLSDWLKNVLEVKRPDVVVAISRFDPELNTILRAIKAKNILLIIKGDTDGSLGYPIPPNYLRARPILAHPLNILRQLKWRAPIRYFVEQKIQHIKMADLVVYESPGAGVSLSHVLRYWGLEDQIKKLCHIPNSIARIYTDLPLVEKTPGTIVSVGRWNDPWPKGSDLLAGVIKDVLQRVSDARFVVVGNNSEYISDRIPVDLREKVLLAGAIDHKEAQSIVATAQIILVPSRIESFSLVSGEALCTGATLVATPIESLYYLAGGGAYGSIARDFSVSAISSALLYELHQWKCHSRDPNTIASYWRSALNEDRIAQIWFRKIAQLIQSG
jgi:glycosyltransferase involved in cell wall biosynthesis